MNRPFYAFGALLGFWVLATLAVSSSSRSTKTTRVSTAAERRLPSARRSGGAVRVFVLPACSSAPQARDIEGAQIELAQTISLPTSIDLTHAWSGVAADDSFAGSGQRISNLTSEELVNLFASLSAPSKPRRLASAVALSRARSRWPVRQLRPLAAGVQNWITWQAERLPLVWLGKQLMASKVAASPAISWSEYAVLIDRTAPQPAVPHGTQVQFVVDHPVQSSGGLLHSAASSLHRLAFWLEGTADELLQKRELAKVN